MIVDDLDLLRIVVSPDETDAILVVDPNTVLSSPFALQGFKSATGENREVSQLLRRVQLKKLPECRSRKRPKPARHRSVKQGFPRRMVTENLIFHKHRSRFGG